MRVWVTRAEPGAARTAERLRALGHQPLVAPLLQVHPIREARVDLTGVGALAFSSANGVAAFAELSARRDLPVYAVGETTAAAARNAGFAEVRSACGDVDDLARLTLSDQAGLRGVVLHPAPREAAGDLAGALNRAGAPARAVAVYETRSLEALPDTATEQLAELDAVLVHSPKAGRALARLAAASRLKAAAHGLAVFGLSPACIEAVGPGFRRTSAATAPEEAALLQLLSEPGGGDPPREAR